MSAACKLNKGPCLPNPYQSYSRQDLVDIATACGIPIRRPPPAKGNKDMTELCRDITHHLRSESPRRPLDAARLALLNRQLAEARPTFGVCKVIKATKEDSGLYTGSYLISVLAFLSCFFHLEVPMRSLLSNWWSIVRRSKVTYNLAKKQWSPLEAVASVWYALQQSEGYTYCLGKSNFLYELYIHKKCQCLCGSVMLHELMRQVDPTLQLYYVRESTADEKHVYLTDGQMALETTEEERQYMIKPLQAGSKVLHSAHDVGLYHLSYLLGQTGNPIECSELFRMRQTIGNSYKQTAMLEITAEQFGKLRNHDQQRFYQIDSHTCRVWTDIMAALDIPPSSGAVNRLQALSDTHADDFLGDTLKIILLCIRMRLIDRDLEQRNQELERLTRLLGHSH